MSVDSARSLRPLGPGMILALLSIVFGFLLGGLFGIGEDYVKSNLRSSAEAVLETVYEGDAATMDEVLSKSWSYLKRAHMHGGGIGAAALASIVLLGLLGSPGRLEQLAALAFGAGALIYPIFWLTAGLTAPSVGGTGAAKEALGFLAIPGAGLCLLGVGGTLTSVLRWFFGQPARTPR